MRTLLALVVVAFALLAPRSASAHGMRAAYLEIIQQSGGRALVRFRLTVPAEHVHPDLPGCTMTEVSRAESDTGDVASTVASCNASLRGRRVGVTGLGAILTEAVVHVTLEDGTVHTAVLTPEAPSFVVPERSGFVAVARAFVGHGLRHVLTGADHVLFLLLLVLTLRRARPVLVAEAAFTLSHTLAFATTALGVVRVSAEAAEACIALSLLLVALDLGTKKEPPRTLHAAGLALAFGVVHGLGFAGGLREIGLPDAHVASALLGFGAGIEIGQLGLCIVGLAAVHLIERLRRAPQVYVAAAYASGTVASAWLFERLSVCFSLR